jgi:SWI/SNF-related matrix-associated actin-dependent regulator 1 of chromatin subfamily A
MIRRLKKDVLKDLPDKIYSYIPMELNNQKEYSKAEANFIEWIKQHKGEKAAKKASNAEALARIGGLRELAVKGKMKQTIEWIKDFIDGNGKLIVFANRKFVIDQLMKEFKDIAVKIDGSTSNAKRDEAVHQFQNKEQVRLFVGNIKAAGVGLTLTAASSVAFIELPWAPGDIDQASDRAHRIGQKDSVNVYYLLASGTIEEELAELIDEKRKIIDSVLDGRSTDENSMLSELMQKYSEAA